jgi:hypothetical protein
MKEYFNTFKIIWKDIFFKIAGNLFPFYIGALILLLLEKDISRVIDNQSFILYSSTFLFSTLYLWYKTIDKKKNEILILLYFFIMGIIISLLYSFVLVDSSKSKLTLLTIIIFSTSIFFYIYYECKIFLISENTKFYDETKNNYNELSESFKNFTEDEQ